MTSSYSKLANLKYENVVAKQKTLHTLISDDKVVIPSPPKSRKQFKDKVELKYSAMKFGKIRGSRLFRCVDLTSIPEVCSVLRRSQTKLNMNFFEENSLILFSFPFDSALPRRPPEFEHLPIQAG